MFEYRYYKFSNILKLIAAVFICELAGFIGSFFTVTAIPGWYNGLSKPFLNPPNWIFGPVWTVLYFLMGVALFLICKNGCREKIVRKAAAVFFVQLFLNAAWSIVFFGTRSPGWAFLNIILLWLAIIWTMVLFFKISKIAGSLLVPYILWVTFACYLNLAIWLIN